MQYRGRAYDGVTRERQFLLQIEYARSHFVPRRPWPQKDRLEVPQFLGDFQHLLARQIWRIQEDS